MFGPALGPSRLALQCVNAFQMRSALDGTLEAMSQGNYGSEQVANLLEGAPDLLEARYLPRIDGGQAAYREIRRLTINGSLMPALPYGRSAVCELPYLHAMRQSPSTGLQ